MRVNSIVIHSQEGKDHHDAFDFPDLNADMVHRGVHYDYYGEMFEEEPYVFRQWNILGVGAHARGWNGTGPNGRAIGFCFAGDGRVENPPAELVVEMAKYIKEAMSAYAIPFERVWLHRNAPGANTDCPGTVFVRDTWPVLQNLIK